MMELLNECAGEGVGRLPAGLAGEVRRAMVLMLAPFAPYLAAELWEAVGDGTALLRHPWPAYDPELAKESEIEYAIQVNGKLRSKVTLPAGTSEDEVTEAALADDKAIAATAGQDHREGDRGQGEAGEYRGSMREVREDGGVSQVVEFSWEVNRVPPPPGVSVARQ